MSRPSFAWGRGGRAAYLVAAFAGASALAGCGDDAGVAQAGAGGSGIGGMGGEPGSGAAAGAPVGAGGNGGGAGDGGRGGAPIDEGFTRYDPVAVRSPISPSVSAAVDAIAARGQGASDVFMKVGASGTVSKSFVTCFAGPDVDWATGPSYAEAVSFFLAGDAAGDNPFERATLAAEVGKSAGWVIGGSPSPLDEEIAAIDPSFALVNYGTNDMGLGATYASALFLFYDNMMSLLDRISADGIVPIVTGLNPRSDSASAARWVPTYDAVTRGMAEARQIPYISLYHAMKDQPDMGLVGDGIHGNAYSEGGAKPCVFTAEALSFNYNLRNLLSIEALDAVQRIAFLGEVGTETGIGGYAGAGDADDPIAIDRLPFTHASSTAIAPSSDWAAYPSCDDDDQDESGPEMVYRLSLDEPTALRLLVLDRDCVDVDLHLLSGAADPSACVARADRRIEGTLEAGVHFVALDTFVSAGEPQAGDYLFVAVACEPSDAACDSPL